MSDLTRRATLAMGLAGLAGPVMAAIDRPVARITGSEIRQIVHCNNAGIPVSSVADRVSRPELFTRTADCLVLRDRFEGPFFNCVAPRGKAIAVGQPGVPLIVALRVQDQHCRPLPGAIVDIWSCDASGRYSGYQRSSHSRAFAPGIVLADNEERHCRGVLATDADGIAEFETIYPGYYSGRAIHIHFKVHRGNTSYLTNQSHLPERLNDKIMAMEPYRTLRHRRRVRNAEEVAWGLTEMTVDETPSGLLAYLTVGLSG